MKFFTYCAPRGNSLITRGYDNGLQFVHQDKNFEVELWRESVTTRDAVFKTLNDTPLVPLRPVGIKEAREAMNVSGVYGAPIHLQPLLKMCSSTEETEAHDYSLIRTGVLDIETISNEGFPEPSEAAFPINSIAYYDTWKSVYHLFTILDGDPRNSPFLPGELQDRVRVYKFDDEVMMLAAFVKMLRIIKPDILIGYNSSPFDFPYIYNRMEKLGLDTNNLSLFGHARKKTVTTQYGPEERVSILGTSLIDWLDLYRWATRTGQVRTILDSEKLDNVAEKELQRKKVDFQGTHWDFAHADPDGFLAYNIVDVQLIVEMEEKLRILQNMVSLAYTYGCNFETALKTVDPWECFIAKTLYYKGILPPTQRHKKTSVEYAGGYVKPTPVGKYGWVLSVDVNSSYPHQIIQYNMSPETVSGRALKVDLDELVAGKIPEIPSGFALSASGRLFSTTQKGFLAEIMDTMFARRKAVKKDMGKLKVERANLASEIAKRGLKVPKS